MGDLGDVLIVCFHLFACYWNWSYACANGLQEHVGLKEGMVYSGYSWLHIYFMTDCMPGELGQLHIGPKETIVLFGGA